MNTDNLLDVNGVAALLDIKPETVRAYHKRGQMPRADRYFGRSPVWDRSSIDTWTKTRGKAVAAAPS